MTTDRLPPIETDPLGAIRKELLSAAWRRKRRGDRRRRMAAVASSVFATFALAVGGAGALGVDLPLVHDALQTLSGGRENAERRSDEPGGDPTLPTSPADVKAGSGNIADVMRIPWPSGSTAFATAYLNSSEDVCLLLVTPDSGSGPSGCTAPAVLAKRLDVGVAYVSAVFDLQPTVIAGYVSPEIRDVTVRGPDGPMEVRLGTPWKPDVAGAAPLRAFVGFSTASDDRAVTARERALDAGAYAIEAHLGDGRTVTVQP